MTHLAKNFRYHWNEDMLPEERIQNLQWLWRMSKQEAISHASKLHCRTDEAACTQEESVCKLVAMKIILRSTSKDAIILPARSLTY